MRRPLAIIATVLMAASTGWMARLLWGSGPPTELPPPPVTSPQVLETLYRTALPDTAGRLQSLEQWRGRVLVINWWATWCGPCRDEMPLFSRLQQRYGARGVQFVGIAADSAEKVVSHAQASPVTYPLLIGGEDAIQATLALGNAPLGVPFTLVLDREGRLQAAVLGRVSERALEPLLDRLL